MVSGEAKDKFLKILFVAGLGFAVLSALEGRIDWLASLCTFWGDGCRETAAVTMFHLPIPIWGVVYYIALIVVAFVAKDWLFFTVMAGAGVELTLVSMMIEMKWICLFCIINLAVVILSVILLYENKRIWQALAISVICFMASDHLLSQDSLGLPAPKPKAPGPHVIAKVGDELIHEQELNEALSSRIYKLEKQIYDLKKERLDFLIDSRLIALDAKNKGLSPEVYTYKVFNEVSVVSDEDVEQYIQGNPGIETNWKGKEAELRKRVRQYLQDIKTREKIDKITKPLITKYSVEIYLETPQLPLTSINQGSSPAIGPEDAPVVVYEFSDYQCPSCRKAHKIAQKIRKKFTGKIRWIFKDYPLDRHEDAWPMAQAAWCANEQGKFWEYQDYLYDFDGHPDTETFKRFARKLDLDEDRFGQCFESGKYKAMIEREKLEGKEAGVSSTPTFVINGRLSPGYISYEKMVDWINQELAKNQL